MSVTAVTQRLVEQRAGGRCEYCRMHQSLQGATFHVEHIVPRVTGGHSDPSNLAWACPGCNLHKGPQTEAVDPETSESVPLFHPRRDRWIDHFSWSGHSMIGLTPTGRATVTCLRLNHERRVTIRIAEERLGLFAPG
jgi:hypothetical protein